MTSTEWMSVVGAGLVGAAVGFSDGWLVMAFTAAGAAGVALLIAALGRGGL